MKQHAVTHINLLQRTGPTHVVAWALAGIMAATVGGLVYYGGGVVGRAADAGRRSDAAAADVKQAQARLAALNTEQAKSARALALSSEIDALKPQAKGAQALVDAVGAAQGGKGDAFGRALASLAGLGEPGLWLTALTVSNGGQRVEVSGQARSGAAVLRYARRANEALQPLALRLDSLEMQPATAAPGGPAGDGAVNFRLY